MPFLIPLSLIVMFLGCFCIYRASPNQRLSPTPWPAAAARAAGAVLLAVAGWACLHAFEVVAAVFVFCTALMFFFSLIPYLGVLVGLRRDDTHEAR